MNTMETIEKVDQTLSNLEASFKAFQDNQEKKIQQLYKSNQRPVLESQDIQSHKNQGFIDYLKSGHEGFGQKALTSHPGNIGGFLIPDPVIERISQSMQQTSSLRSLARVTTISSDTLELLLDKGSSDVGWVSELADRPETDTPELAKVKISVHQIYAKPRASQKILDDARIDVENWLVGKVSEKMAMSENAAFINGDGDNKPKGFLSYELVPVGDGEWGKIESLKMNVGDKFATDVLLDAINAMKPQYLHGAVWLMSRSALTAVRKIKEEFGQYLWQSGLTAGAPSTLLGYPVIINDEMPALSDEKASTSIVFANFHEAYQIVDRASMHVLRDPYSAKPYVEFYVTKRVGGDVINFDAIKAIQFSKE